MTRTALATKHFDTSQKSSRQGATIDTIIWHHQAGTSSESVKNAMVFATKGVSSNVIITNEGDVWTLMDEEWRAWTSGSTSDGGKGAAWDRRALTVEIENETGAPEWRISAKAFAAAQRLRADWFARYRIRNEFGHRDLWTRFRASYPTFCPGPNTVSIIQSGSIANLPTPAPVLAGPAPAPSVDYAFGLTTGVQRAIQKALARLGRYSGDQDGRFGGMSVSAMQQWLKDNGYLAADYKVDGIPGPIYGLALQSLALQFGYTGDMDGKPGTMTSRALVKWANSIKGARPGTVKAEGRDWSYWEPKGALAKRVQRALKARGRYAGPIDGKFGEYTRKGVQITLNVSGEFKGAVDGVIERGGCYGIQTYGKRFGDYRGSVDGAPREASWEAFALGLERP